MAFTRVARLSDLPPGELIEIIHNERPYALCNVGGDIRALHGVCPHQGGPLGQGALEDGLITCPWHSWQFDSATGDCTYFETLAIPVYPVRVEAEEILIDVPDA